MISPYIIPIATLLRDVPSSRAINFTAPFDEGHEFEPRALGEANVASGAPTRIEGSLASYPGGLRFVGTVSAPWTALCRRCSAPIEQTLTVTVKERFVEDMPEDNDEAYGYQGEELNLAAMVHDAIFLELPLGPLCKEDCLGLCPQCGGDRNETPCDCAAPVDPRWAKLSELLGDDSSGS